jgi:hypothetical protein
MMPIKVGRTVFTVLIDYWWIGLKLSNLMIEQQVNDNQNKHWDTHEPA